ncbi:MAG TPA: serine/threonine-protein kinase [Thermoanaerobaculia bacterium]|jgi:serine/threonine protein kinase|nr:serine/threonine-protein kinase [Thermoanaerobaculia bacterium]
MNGLSDAALRHLREVADLPDLSGTPYEVVETLGRGGMGTVYRALDHRLDREVALKVVQISEVADGDVDRLLREARVLARLEHPGIVPVHDAGRLPDGRAFYAMKRVRGRRLDEHARTVSLPERLRAFQRICEAVAFAHAHGVIHRDLKPENVMVGPFGEVLVMDWGVAKVTGLPPVPAGEEGRGGEGTAHGTILGTPGYMAPEQERGEVDRIDERTDVWALGAILRFLLGNEEPPRPLEAIRRRAMAEEPEGRYPKVEDLAADLSRYLAGLPVGAHREGILERAGRFTRRHRTPILLILAYLVMRVILILVFRR